MMTAPIATAILFVIAIGGLIWVGKRSKRPTYLPIDPSDDPLDEGVKGWSGLARKLRAQRLIKLLYVLGASALALYGWVALQEPVRVLYEHYNPPPTATATLIPTATPTSEITETPSP